MEASRLLLYTIGWQCVRISLQGNWGSVRGVRNNLETLEAYLKGSKDNLELFVRCWQALNCLNAVRMGYSGQGLTDSDQDKLVRTFRNSISQEYRLLRNACQKQIRRLVPTVQSTRSAWRQLNPETRHSIVDDLHKRLARSSGGGSAELRWFLELIDEGSDG